ncbi:MAG TPA: response regulator transcription factor [Flavisolibacter sp.]|nr:response regulator transcription factor [Flavisolibacter sp.]
MKKPVKILIADDHKLLLDGISSLLEDEEGIEIVAKAFNGIEVLDILKTKECDICLLDISMPELDGIATAKLIKERNPSVKVMMLTTYNDREFVEELVDIGVFGYLLKNSTKEELVQAIRKVYSGGMYFSDEVQQTLFRDYVKLTREKNQKDVMLTHREVEILKLLAKEFTNEKIAKELNISYRTVETHRKNLLHKTDSHNLAGLLKYAYSKNLID